MVKKLMRPCAHNISAAPKPFTTLHGAFTCILADRRKEQHIALALVMPLMLTVICETQTFFTSKLTSLQAVYGAKTALVRDPPGAAPALLLWPWAGTAP